MEPFQSIDPSYFEIIQWKKFDSQLLAGFTTKLDGFSQGHYRSNNFGLHVGDDPETVNQNRQGMAKKLQIQLNYWVFAQQIHGNQVQYVGKKERGRGSFIYDTSITDTDGLYTDEKGILLALLFADCVPIYFYAPIERKIGIVHAGWRGTVKKVAIQLLEKWTQEGISPKNVYATIGPSICNHCYIVDNKVIKIVDSLQLDEKVYEEKERDQFSLDLKKINMILLRKFGIPIENILITDYCTSCHSDLFFSHRRDGGKTGRMIGFIGFRED
ncbi:peptidoglycan editing factor PgeF [Fervidibacillus halotolerans]|uniref:Purine nucleoside phosphorylase n=1 Tax=Fervidibacillus halotolerans TaxID=2980027 RepID=A0A9E8M1W8_9BACI|nr:peptidoglycan editing factor PgeF [Fervidibacillus halotolerans]WAA13671.1 peptidoglycan editing factor PgeF [Fervidibacillus halotolerans]